MNVCMYDTHENVSTCIPIAIPTAAESVNVFAICGTAGHINLFVPACGHLFISCLPQHDEGAEIIRPLGPASQAPTRQVQRRSHDGNTEPGRMAAQDERHQKAAAAED